MLPLREAGLAFLFSVGRPFLNPLPPGSLAPHPHPAAGNFSAFLSNAGFISRKWADGTETLPPVPLCVMHGERPGQQDLRVVCTLQLILVLGAILTRKDTPSPPPNATRTPLPLQLCPV